VEDIRRMFGAEAEIILANDTPDLVAQPLAPIQKESGSLKLVTISLITAKKGHLTLLETLKALEDQISVEYHIYGPVKDPDYWQACQQQIALLKPSIKVVYHGNIHPTEVTATLQQYHFFVLPSKGENFGHAIYEAFNAGRPVIISNQTPWKKLQQQQAGWDVDLQDRKALSEALKRAYQMNQTEYEAWCRGARGVARRFVDESNFTDQYNTLFK
jgi:glycosyltransferase involved in cell wall biosynthesis